MSEIRKDVQELFDQAGFTREDGGENFDDIALQMADILDTKMSWLSATMGLSWKRVELYEEQKQSIIADLKKIKEERSNERKSK